MASIKTSLMLLLLVSYLLHENACVVQKSTSRSSNNGGGGWLSNLLGRSKSNKAQVKPKVAIAVPAPPSSVHKPVSVQVHISNRQAGYTTPAAKHKTFIKKPSLEKEDFEVDENFPEELADFLRDNANLDFGKEDYDDELTTLSSNGKTHLNYGLVKYVMVITIAATNLV